MSRWMPWAAQLLALVLLALAPRYLDDFRLLILTEILIFGLLAASLDLLTGYTGLPSLGHAAYFGVGGYTAAIVARELTKNGVSQLAVAVGVTAGVALVTGWLAVRTRGVYFLMLTLAFAQLLFSLALSWDDVTGGSNGLAAIPRVRLWDGFPRQARDVYDQDFYYVVLAACVLGYLLLRQIVVSPFGRALEGIRENEGRMRAVGYATVPYKLAAFCVAGAVGGYAGALYAQQQRFVSPSNVSFEISALALIMVIIGGMRTLYGPVLGAAMVILLRDELSSQFQDRWRLALGLVFIGVVYFLPRGIAGALRLLPLSLNLRTHEGRERPASMQGPDAVPNPQETATITSEHDQEPLPPRGGGAGERGHPEHAPIVLELDRVSKLFGSLRAVDRVSLTVREGQRHALIGPNGAGKSTLFNMVAGASPVSDGRVVFRGRDITHMKEHRRSGLGIGKTFQHSNVFGGLSTLDNVCIPVQRTMGLASRFLRPASSYRAVSGRALQALRSVGLGHRASARAADLSHGERRQLEVAMALATEPSLLLLDEPTAGMSRAEADAFVRLIKGLPQSLTVLIIEHDIDVVLALADRISVLHVGLLLAEGTPDEIRASPQVQEAYLGGDHTEELFERTV